MKHKKLYGIFEDCYVSGINDEHFPEEGDSIPVLLHNLGLFADKEKANKRADKHNRSGEERSDGGYYVMEVRVRK